MMRHAFGTNANLAELFMALAFGYIVCYLAHREEKLLKRLGYIIGIVIIIGTALVILDKALLRVQRYQACKECMHRHGKMSIPFKPGGPQEKELPPAAPQP